MNLEVLSIKNETLNNSKSFHIKENISAFLMVIRYAEVYQVIQINRQIK